MNVRLSSFKSFLQRSAAEAWRSSLQYLQSVNWQADQQRRGADASVLQEVLTNKQGMTLEQQILVCAKPYVRGSIELFLRALVADQFVKQKRALLPLVTAELPNTAK